MSQPSIIPDYDDWKRNEMNQFQNAPARTETAPQTIARLQWEAAKKRRDDLCHLHTQFDQIREDCCKYGYANIGDFAKLGQLALEGRMIQIGISDPTEEVCAYIDEKPVCRICALSDANCKCSRDDVRTDSSALAERG